MYLSIEIRSKWPYCYIYTLDPWSHLSGVLLKAYGGRQIPGPASLGELRDKSGVVWLVEVLWKKCSSV